jgi:uncharacterized protein YndB with AHSA1/START domain
MSNEPSVARIFIKAPIQTVWDHIVDPEFNGRYAYMSPGTYDLTPGGRYECRSTPQMREYGAPELMCDGEIISADPPKKLVMTWQAYFNEETVAEGARTLTWELWDDEFGVTCVTVTHDVGDAPVTKVFVTGSDPESPGGGGGWAWILSDLKHYLETGTSMFAAPGA